MWYASLMIHPHPIVKRADAINIGDKVLVPSWGRWCEVIFIARDYIESGKDYGAITLHYSAISREQFTSDARLVVGFEDPRND